jgi:cysteinyl-tRNA synthetase
MKLYNTLTRKQEKLKPINPPQVTMYNCGPTVYQFPHIGNWRSFLVADFLKRSLNYLGYQVKQVMNVTDVGHLTSDADSGQDKVELEAKKENKSAQEIADFYLQAFIEDSRLLNVESPQVMPRASEHIAEMIKLVQKLEKKGYTYQTSDGIYFNTAKFKKYGQLSGQKAEEKKAGARIDFSEEKINPTDFALWKFSPKETKRQQEWLSPWGMGFPGWHIECSVLSKKYLGQPFDIHSGGVDHIGVHHENEMAQSEAAYNKPQANLWLHVEFLQMKDAKMSKSKGGFITVKDLIKKGYNPLAYRIFVLASHYQSKQNFSWASINQAEKNLNKIHQTARRLQEYSSSLKNKSKSDLNKHRRDFKKNLRNNLDTPQLLATVFNFTNEVNRLIDQKKLANIEAKKLLKTLIEWDQVLGINIEKIVSNKDNIPQEIRIMVQEREKMRQSKQWEQADSIRKKIQEKGYRIEDSDQGTEITLI